MEDKAKYLLGRGKTVEYVQYVTGISVDRLQELAAQAAAEKIVHKAEIRDERERLRIENGACPWCAAGYAIVSFTWRPASWFTEPIDFYAKAECSNPRCAMRTLQPMPDERAAREYFVNGHPGCPYPEYAQLSKYGQMHMLISLIREGWDDDVLRRFGFLQKAINKYRLVEQLNNPDFDIELMCPVCGANGEWRQAVNPRTRSREYGLCWWRVGCPKCHARLKHSFPTKGEAQAAWAAHDFDRKPA